jgi:uncharacterized membrane protein YfbV (UPF0208 family)
MLLDSYTGLLMNPAFLIHRMQRIVEKHGRQEAESSGRFKHEREAWTSAVWALGQTELTGQQLWVEIETIEQTPDTKVHHLDKSKGYHHLQTWNLEVVDWVPQVDSVMNVIEQKCKKAYPSFFSLVVFARSGRVLSTEAVAETLRSINVPFSEIWIIGRASETDATIHLVKVHPTVLHTSFDLRDALEKAQPQQQILQLGKRGMTTEILNLGSAYLPIP